MERYRKLAELTKDELEELKERVLIEIGDYEQIIKDYDADLLDEEQLTASLRICKTQKVTYKDLELFYGAVEFVEDDFFCNCYKEEEEKKEPLGLNDLIVLALKLSHSQGFYGRLYAKLSKLSTEEREKVDKEIKSWKCYDDVDLILRFE